MVGWFGCFVLFLTLINWLVILVVVMLVSFFLSRIRGKYLGRKTLDSLLLTHTPSLKKMESGGVGADGKWVAANTTAAAANARKLKKTAKNIAKMTLMGMKWCAA